MVNKYGLDMKGLRKAAGETHGIPKGYHMEIWYSSKFDEVSYSGILDENSWTEHHNGEWECVMLAGGRRSMQQIADAIHFYLENGFMKPNWM